MPAYKSKNEYLLCRQPEALKVIQMDLLTVSALTLLVGRQEGHPASEKYGGMVEVGTG